jgi:hypothetical protein
MPQKTGKSISRGRERGKPLLKQFQSPCGGLIWRAIGESPDVRPMGRAPAIKPLVIRTTMGYSAVDMTGSPLVSPGSIWILCALYQLLFLGDDGRLQWLSPDPH